MGMYDTINLDVKCPYCGETSFMGVQTKDLVNCLYEFQVGDHVSDRFNYLYAIAECKKQGCKGNQNSAEYLKGLFDITIELVCGIITGKYKIIEYQ